MTIRLAALVVTLGALLACGGASPTASPTGSPGPSASAPPTGSPSTPPSSVSPSPSLAPSPSKSPSPSGSPLPSGSPTSAVAVVKIEEVGGFIGPNVTLSRYPTVVLYEDGRLIMQGPQIEIYPGPALPNLQVTQLTPAGVQQVLDWATQAGLEGEDRFLGQPMPDAGTMVFTVVRGDQTHTTSVSDMSSDDQAVGALRQFQDVMTNIRQWLPAEDVVGDDIAYDWSALQILATPADPASMPDPSLVTILDWPLASLATIGLDAGGQRCAVIEGADLATLKPMLETANELTMWRSESVTYQVLLHPLLPDDPGCSGFAGP